MKKRTYTISYGTTGLDVPNIKIVGKWLKKLGFNVGDKIEVIEDENKLTLIKIA